MLVRVALSANIPEPLTYRFPGSPTEVQNGLRVVVPLGKRITSGWIVGIDSQYAGPAKAIVGVIRDRYIPDSGYLEFIREAAGIHFISMGLLLDHSLSPKRKPIQSLSFESGGKSRKLKDTTAHELIRMSSDRPLEFHYSFSNDREGPPSVVKPIPSEAGGARLILGYDRFSGYNEIVEECARAGQSLILVVPDPVTAQYWNQRFPDSRFYTSEAKPLQRERIWDDLQSGATRFIIGGLAAIFLPAADLGCIIVDRAGSGLYQPTSYSPLSVRRLAEIRAHSCRIPLVEGHSSHTVDSYLARNELPVRDDRDPGRTSVDVRMIQKGEKGIPKELIDLAKSHYLAGRKTWIILNRRKGGGYLFCPECKRIEKCPACGGSLEVGEDFSASCRACAFRSRRMHECGRCRKELSLNREMDLESLERAIQRTIAEKGVWTLLPEKKTDWRELAGRTAECSILLSTLRAVNPLFRDTFDVIVYVRPESLFNMNRYNSAEMIFSTVSEMRALVKEKGQVVVFSAYHFHYALQLVDREADFFERELKYRSWFLLPPIATFTCWK